MLHRFHRFDRLLGVALILGACGSSWCRGDARASEDGTVAPVAVSGSQPTNFVPPPDSMSPGSPLYRSTLFPPRLASGNLTYLPKVYYSGESGVGFGGQVQYTLPWGDSRSGYPGSSLFFEGRVTTQGQAKLVLKGEFEPTRSAYQLKLKLLHSTISRRFWGVGSDTPDDALEIYRPRQTLGYVELHRRITNDLRVGLRAEAEHQEYLETAAGGAIESRELPGTDGGTAVGMGMTVEWDRRDDRLYPTRGFYYQGFAMLFNRALGSSYTFNQYNFDLRHYLPVAGGGVLALQLFGYSAQGSETPFWRYAALGGRAHSRGYRSGRYLGRTLLAFQGEFRMPPLWRFAPTVFAGLSDVAEGFDQIELSHMRPTVGAGLRTRLDSSGRKWARVEAAYGQELRLYAGLGVAF